MIERTSFDYTLQTPYGICVVFSYAKAIDALTEHKTTFFEVLNLLYVTMQAELGQTCQTFSAWQQIVTPLYRTFALYIDRFKTEPHVNGLNHEFLAQHMYPKLKDRIEKQIVVTHPFVYNIQELQNKTAVVSYPFHHGFGAPMPCHIVNVAFDTELYIVDPNKNRPYAFNCLETLYDDVLHSTSDCILFEV